MYTHYIKIKRLLIALLIVLPGLLAAQGIKITSGGNLVANGAAKLVIMNAGFTNNGTFTPDLSSVIFSGNGSTSSSFIAGSTSTTFTKLVLNKSANGFQLNQHIGVSGVVDLQSGDSIFLNAFNIDLGSTGSLTGETNALHITGQSGGYIQIVNTLNAPSSVNPGNLGFTISSASNLGSTVIKRGHQNHGPSVYQYFDITPTNNSGLNATVKFAYFQPEINSIPEIDLALFGSTDGGNVWSLESGSTVNIGSDFVQASAVSQMGLFTLANANASLALKFIYFKAIAADAKNVLYWATATESRNDYFIIERSIDGTHFLPIGRVEAAGNSNNIRNYSFTDAASLSGMVFYRLKCVDIDNKANYSIVVKLGLNTINKSIHIYPNPASDYVSIEFTAESAGKAEIQILSIAGVKVLSKQVDCVKGVNIISVPISSLANGTYKVQVPGKLVRGATFIKN